MKFSATIQFNAVREWVDYYVNYGKLKHVIYDIERAQADIFRHEELKDEEIGMLWTYPSVKEKEARFLNSLESELDKVNEFYEQKEAELLSQLKELIEFSDMVFQEKDGSSEQGLLNIRLRSGDRDTIAKQCRELYINLCSLKEFTVLNYTAFSKILKKHDKVLGADLKKSFMPKVEESYFWQRNSSFGNLPVLNDSIEKVVQVYAKVFFDNNQEKAASDLGHYLREFVVWERNTIWKEMVGQERRVTSAGLKRVEEPSAPKWSVKVPYTEIYVSVEKKVIPLAICLLVFFVLASVSIFDDVAKNRCFAVLVFSTMMWASEVIPLFVTSMCIPFLLITMGVLVSHENGKEGQPLPADAAAKMIFSKMFASVIMLLLGGFTIAAALSKYHIAKRGATVILSKAGTRSRNILLAIMGVATFSSMWISNVAAPVLCYSVIEPILRTLEPGNGFAKSLVMGIALASNIGGMVTPISSPQNAVALENMDPSISWLTWLAVTIPLSVVSLIICWAALLLYYNPGRSTPFVQPIRIVQEPLDRTQIYILVVTGFTISLWLLESLIRPVVGNSGVIAIVPMVAFFATGILTKDDFNSFLWSVIMLAMGGISLGVAVENTNLLNVIASGVAQSLKAQPLGVALLCFCSVVLVVATLISHTVSALIVLPLVHSVGIHLPGDHANLLVMGTAMMCSGAMGLPISGFPNITAVSIEDATGKPYVKTRDFLRIGIPMSIMVCILTVSLGFGMMLLVGL